MRILCGGRLLGYSVRAGLVGKAPYRAKREKEKERE